MKCKLLLTFSVCFFMHAKLDAQNSSEKPVTTYRIQVEGITDLNLLQATSLLNQITKAENVSFDKSNNLFTLTTLEVLDKNIVAGKMQKNFFPIVSFQKAGEVIAEFPKMKNTGNPDADAAVYEQEKSKWISENPDEYKKMLNNPSVKSTPNK